MKGSRLSRAWSRFWFDPVDPLPLAVFRIALGLLVLAFLAALAPNWSRFYAADGIPGLAGDGASAPGLEAWSVFSYLEPGWMVRAVWWAALAAAMAFTVGWWTRTATVVLFVVQSSMNNVSPMVINGEDLLFRALLFLSCFAPLGACLSIDARRAARSSAGEGPPRVHEAWAWRLLQLQVVAIYAFSLPAKLADDAAWTDGTAIYWSLACDFWRRGSDATFYARPWVTGTLTWATVLIEGAFPVLVWFRRTRLWVIALAALMHLSIAVVMQNVTFFTLGMVCSLLLFVPAPLLRRLRRGIARVDAPRPGVTRA